MIIGAKWADGERGLAGSLGGSLAIRTSQDVMQLAVAILVPQRASPNVTFYGCRGLAKMRDRREQQRMWGSFSELEMDRDLMIKRNLISDVL